MKPRLYRFNEDIIARIGGLFVRDVMPFRPNLGVCTECTQIVWVAPRRYVRAKKDPLICAECLDLPF